MKKFYLVLFVFFACNLAFSQSLVPPHNAHNPYAKATVAKDLKGDGQVFYHEDFDWENPDDPKGWTLPEGFTLEDPSDIGYNWHWAKDSIFGVFVAAPPIQSETMDNGYLCLNVGMYNEDFGIDGYGMMVGVDNSIVFPPIDCSEHTSVVVSFQQHFRYWSEATMQVDVSADGGAHWAPFDCKMGTPYSETPLNVAAGVPVLFEANVTQVAAGMPSVIFKITWQSARLYFWQLDDFKLKEAYSNEIQLTHSILDYDNGIDDEREGFFYHLPKTQIAGHFFEGGVKNFGEETQTNVHLDVEVFKNHVSQFHEMSDPLSQTQMAWDTLYIDEIYTPVEFGHYEVKMQMKSDAEDQVPENNAVSYFFNVTDSIFSRSDDTPEKNFSTCGNYDDLHEGDFMGTKYTLQEDMEINSISCYISRGNPDVTFMYGLYEVVPEEEQPIELLVTEMISYDSTAMHGKWLTLPVEKDGEGEFLLAGHTYLAGVVYWMNTEERDVIRYQQFQIGSDTDVLRTGQSSWTSSGLGDAWYVNGGDLLMTRIHFNDDSNIIDGVSEINNSFSMGQNYPNPSNGLTSIDYRLGRDCHAKIEVFDMNGRKVLEKAEGLKPAGTHTCILNTSNLESGIYSYILTAGKYQETRRMIISK